MNDLVERLKAIAWQQVDQRGDMLYKGEADPWLVEAIARITELEADLTRYVESLHHMREAADRQRAIMQNAHVDGVRAGIEAAAGDALEWFPEGAQDHPKYSVVASIRALDPEAIVRAGIKVARGSDQNPIK